MRIRAALTATLAGLALVVMTACGSTTPAADTSSSPAASAESSNSQFPIEITHAFGTTVIEEQPERIAAIAWGNLDVPLALGVMPVGSDTQVWDWDSDSDPGFYTWTTDAITELGGDAPEIFTTGDGIDFEAIADTNPDVILAALSGLSEDDYATLSDIAPVVAYPEIAWYTPWREQITMNATALGLQSEGDALVADLDEQIAAAVADVDAFDGKTAAFFYMSPADLSTISIYTSGDQRTAFLEDLGFTMPQFAVDALSGGSFYADLSAENADQIADVDVIVTYGDETLLPALQADPAWSTVPAVANGAVLTVGNGDDFSAAVSPTALSIPWVLDTYVARLVEAAALSR